MIFPVTFMFVVFACALPVAAAGLVFGWLTRSASRLLDHFRRADEAGFDWEKFEREFQEYANPGWAAARREERHE